MSDAGRSHGATGEAAAIKTSRLGVPRWRLFPSTADIDSSLPEIRPGMEQLQQLLVGGRKTVLTELCRLDPGEGMAAKELRLIDLAGAAIELQMHSLFRVGMGDGLQKLSRFHVNAKLFAQLPAQTCLKAFARLALAPRELPETAQVILRSTFGN